jgi:hypothetical protein
LKHWFGFSSAMRRELPHFIISLGSVFTFLATAKFCLCQYPFRLSKTTHNLVSSELLFANYFVVVINMLLHGF